MADPLSIIASTTSIIDVCVRLVSYLRDVDAAAGKIEGDLIALQTEFTSLQAINNAIHETWLDHHNTPDPQAPPDQPLIKRQWQDLNHALNGCNSMILRLGALIEEVVGKNGHRVSSKLDGIKKVLRKQSKDKEILEIRQQVMSHRDNLQVLLQALNLSYTRNSQTSIGRSLGDVSDEVTSQGFQLQRRIDILLSRTAFMNSALLLGVFWVDGRSEETIRYTYSNIAKAAGLEPNDLAAKNWLANLVYPWLLLIDNADDRDMDLSKHFPTGERGFVLVTTRNPYNRTLGTLGDKFYDFDQEILDHDESNELLLKAADESRRIAAVRDAAARIAQRLGYLPLALVQAGKAILRGMCTCTLWNYLDVYDLSWQRIRRARSLSDVRSTLSNDEVVNMKPVYSSYEIIFRGLENTPALSTQDAVDLLKMFSFLSNESLRMNVFITAVRHPQRQRQYDEEQAAKKAVAMDFAPSSWTSTLREYLIWIVRQMDKSSPVLPAVLREDTFDEARLGDAMGQLASLSLVHYQREDNSYSMHPLIHTWVRERPEMSNAQQALWCQVASSTLAQSILLPPLDTIDTAESLRRHLLLHVRHVQKCRESINSKLIANRQSRKRLFWDPLSPGLTRQLALEYAKFSLVYFNNGFYVEAEDLQLKVKDFVVSRLGTGNPLAWRVTLALSATYFALSKTNKAGELQAQVLESCRRTLGPDHPQTLRYTDLLGASRCFQGRFKESRRLHELAIEGMTKVLGPDSEENLIATDNLGKIMWRYFEYETAHDLHAKAFEGLSRVLGPTHEKTLQAKEGLALSCIDLPNADLREAHAMMLEVKRERKRRLGTEQPWTLLARCNLARVKSAMGDHTSAERLMRKALPIAERNLGENHLGTLMGKTHLAQVLLRQRRYTDAEAMLLDVIQRHWYGNAARDDGEHPDRIFAMRYLLTCYKEHGKFAEALELCDQLHVAVSTVGGEGLGLLHPITKWLDATRSELRQQEEQLRQMRKSSDGAGHEASVSADGIPPPEKRALDPLPTDCESEEASLVMTSQARSKTY